MMRIAIIAGNKGKIEALIGGLKSAGHDVVFFEIQEAHGIKDYLALSNLFPDADTFDIIHSHIGTSPLLFSRFISTPIVTTIYDQPSKDDVYIYDRYKDICFYVATSHSTVASELPYIASIDPKQSDMADSYMRVYDDIMKGSAREDHRPWGYYEVLSDDKADHKVKRITVWPKKRLSLQMHHRRKEHWVIVSGQALVTLGQEHISLGPSQSIDIPLEAPHRIENTGDIPLVFIEVQQGDYFGEDDIVRLADDFGRK